MRYSVFGLVVLLFGLCLGRAAATEDTCGRFAVEVGFAETAYADYRAYVNDGDSDDLALAALKAFSHFLSVADEYSQNCEISTHKGVFGNYTRLEWYRNESEFGQYVAGVSQEKRDIAKAQSSELKLLWALGFGKSNDAEYSAMKRTTEAHFSELGLTFLSPETGRVLVAGNAALANCDKNDHDGGFGGVSLAYPQDAAKAKLGGRFNIDVTVDEKGVPISAIATPEDFPLDDLNKELLVRHVQDELAAEAQAATWTPTVVACRPMAEGMLMVTATLDPATGTVTLEPWHSDPH